MPDSMKLFSKQRPRDINLEIPISEKSQVLNYYQFNEPALNGFDQNITLARENYTNYKVISTKKLKTYPLYPLNEVLEKYMPEEQEIDFLSVDVEGLDLEVLHSNDWLKFRPKVILVECLELKKASFDQIHNTKIYKFLTEKNYLIYPKTFGTVFYISQDYLAEMNR